MSEYQCYQFLAIDKPLSENELKKIRELSSRAQITNTSARFVYNYGDFRGNAREILGRYYDAMFYIANWGTKQLMFRFPKEMICSAEIFPFCDKNHILLSDFDEYYILDFHFNEEDGGDWIEEEDWLSLLIPLRDDILKKDYRVLYIAWLNTIQFKDSVSDEYEPDIPPGLNDLTTPLKNLIELFKVDRNLLRAASKESREMEQIATGRIKESIENLSPKECKNFLWRLANEESNLSIKLMNRLNELAIKPARLKNERRTVKKLLEIAKKEEVKEKDRLAKEAEERRVESLNQIIRQKHTFWQQVDELFLKSNPKAYQEGVKLLLKLKEVAEYENDMTSFQGKINQIHVQYGRRPLLIQLLKNNKLNAE